MLKKLLFGGFFGGRGEGGGISDASHSFSFGKDALKGKKG